MKIKLKEIKYYYLTCDTNGVRKKHIVNEFKDYDLTEVIPVLNIERCRSGVTGHSKMIDLGLRNQDRTKPFQPFVLFEDDVSKYREFPEEITVPVNTDILYIGLSKIGRINTKKNYTKDIYYKKINSNLIRLYNMCSTHGIMICSASGALAIQKCLLEGYFKLKIWDRYTAFIQPYYNVYALSNPLVYQNSRIGGNELDTKFNLKNKSGRDIPKKYINTSNISIITCQKLSQN